MITASLQMIENGQPLAPLFYGFKGCRVVCSTEPTAAALPRHEQAEIVRAAKADFSDTAKSANAFHDTQAVLTFYRDGVPVATRSAFLKLVDSRDYE